jgi:hypothetical protein
MILQTGCQGPTEGDVQKTQGELETLADTSRDVRIDDLLARIDEMPPDATLEEKIQYQGDIESVLEAIQVKLDTLEQIEKRLSGPEPPKEQTTERELYKRYKQNIAAFHEEKRQIAIVGDALQKRLDEISAEIAISEAETSEELPEGLA